MTRPRLNEAAWNKLLAFRAKLKKRHTCTYWTNAEELKARAIVGLTAAMKRHPALGWVRSDQVPSGATIAEVLTLRNRVGDLEAQLAATGLGPPPGAEDLHQGEDEVTVPVSFTVHPAGTYSPGCLTAKIRVTWNEVFAAVAPSMIDEATDAEFAESFNRFFFARVRGVFEDEEDFKDKRWASVTVSDTVREDFIVQFRALGLMRESSRAHSVRDTRTYWTLTPYGDNLMTRLRASRRTPLTAPDQAVTAAPEAPPATRSRRKAKG